jgi:ssDNA-binding Zn-finger/Zn-ribbon topoisomerase 1
MSRMNWDLVRDETRVFTHGYEQLSRPKGADKPASNQALLDVRCPFCQSKAVRRQSRFGLFLGCGRYPQCTATCNLSADGAVRGEWRRGKPPKSSTTTRKRGRDRRYGLG